MKQLELLIPRPLTRYKIKYRNKVFNCWFTKSGWVSDGYSTLNDKKVTIIKKIGTPKEIFA